MKASVITFFVLGLALFWAACGDSGTLAEGHATASQPSRSSSQAAAVLKPYAPKEAEVLDFAGVDIGDAPLKGAAESSTTLAEAIVHALAEGDRRAVETVLVSEPEYSERLFEVLIHHRSALKMGAALTWAELSGESNGDLDNALGRYRDQPMTLVRLELGEPLRRPKLDLYQAPKLVVEIGGEEKTLPILGSVIEHRPSGGWKVLAFRD